MSWKKLYSPSKNQDNFNFTIGKYPDKKYNSSKNKYKRYFIGFFEYPRVLALKIIRNL